MATCRRCGRPLTRPESVARGVGPVCGGPHLTRSLHSDAGRGASSKKSDGCLFKRLAQVNPAQCELWAVQMVLPGMGWW